MIGRKTAAVLGLSACIMMGGSSAGYANTDVEALRLELQSLKNDYQMKITELQTQIDLLAKQNDAQMKKMG
ncbi:MAG: hypothetical protein KC649_02510, partial [Candidatus Omnitrophica bacterium]|nr:hypothetical protein [Candidatus Omnitrophota bacterium]